MRAVEITAPMPLLNDGERKAAQIHVNQGLDDHNQREDYASAAQHFTEAAKLGHPAALCMLAAYYGAGLAVPKDDRMAFQLYLEAGRHGNILAQRRTGECYLSGRGVEADLETGIAWLEAAGHNKDVKACEKLAHIYGSTSLRDAKREAFWRARAEELSGDGRRSPCQSGTETAKPVYPGQGGSHGYPASAMPPLGPGADDFQRTELYYSRAFHKMDAGVANRRLYYLCRDNHNRTKLCASDLDGGNPQVLADAEQYEGAYLAATSVSVFLYDTAVGRRGNTVLQVKELPLDGGQPREFQVEADDDTARSVYIYASSLYYVLHKNGKCCLCVYHGETGTSRVLYQRAAEITAVYAGLDYVIFHAEYEKNDLREDGWMMYWMHTGQVQCLDCSLSPENVLDHPQYYNEDSRSYVKDVRRRKIAFFDLARDIMWVEHADGGPGGTLCLVAHSLRGEGHPRRQELPVWHLDPEWWGRMRGRLVYFDGDRMYAAPSYYCFESCDRDGTVYQWDLHNNGHGCCEQFCVFGDHLFLDGDTHGEKVYRAVAAPTAPLKDSWRKKAPSEASAKQSESAPAMGCERPDLEVTKTLTATDVKYGILTLGTKFHIGLALPVTVMAGGKGYSGKMHATTKGRVDGLKRMFAEQGLNEGDRVRAAYMEAQGVIYLERI